MTVHFGFTPDPERARLLDERMHLELGASLRHLCDASRDVVPFDRDDMSRLIRSLESGERHEPHVFGEYYMLAGSLFDQDHDAAAGWFERLSEARPISEGPPAVGPLGDPRLSEKSALYQAMMTGETDTDALMLPPSTETAREFEQRFRQGMELMSRAIPELAGEIRALVHEVICVVANPERETRFDGGSHYQLWGALFLNADVHRTERAIVEVVAHESAHSLLFGFCTDEPLVYNDDEARYPSPLRDDPRPMDGIYHATFVSARMHWAMSRMIDSGLLDAEALEEARVARRADHDHFVAGYEVVARHGDMSEIGRRLMNGAREYMDSVPS